MKANEFVEVLFWVFWKIFILFYLFSQVLESLDSSGLVQRYGICFDKMEMSFLMVGINFKGFFVVFLILLL